MLCYICALGPLLVVFFTLPNAIPSRASACTFIIPARRERRFSIRLPVSSTHAFITSEGIFSVNDMVFLHHLLGRSMKLSTSPPSQPLTE